MNKPALRPLAAAIALALPLALPATADAQSWMARVRAIDIEPNVSSSINGLDVDNAWVPELDFTYFFSKNLAAELILATARHEVTLNGTSVGKVSILPPTITVQYHFTDLGAWKPYVGGGVNLTYFYNVGLTNAAGSLRRLERRRRAAGRPRLRDPEERLPQPRRQVRVGEQRRDRRQRDHRRPQDQPLGLRHRRGLAVLSASSSRSKPTGAFAAPVCFMSLPGLAAA